jgi:hypothetical protein
LSAARQPRKPHHCSQLKDVLFPSLDLVDLPELSRQRLATSDVLGANEVNRYLDAVRRVSYLQGVSDAARRAEVAEANLMCTTCWNEDGLPRHLIDSVAFDAMLLK